MTHLTMDSASYKSLLAKTQEALRLGSKSKELQVPSCDALLKDCCTCIEVNLYTVTGLLSEAEVCISQVTDYLSDASNLLELLTNYIENNIESEFMTCHETKTFPNSVASIIGTVFSHCKDSENICGSNLSCLEEHLKGLFRNCHNLQLTYLEVLDKHFVFDLTNEKEKQVLIEALAINLKIGETVKSLDVKSMAVQWKTMTIIYEKYSAILSDTTIFQDCLAVLCALIKSHINIYEENQDDKVIERSLKLANFLLKILLKVCDTFGHAASKEYKNVIYLLFYIHKISAHLQTTTARSRFINLIQSPSECLLKKLLYDETFGHLMAVTAIVQRKVMKIDVYELSPVIYSQTLLGYDIGNIKQEGMFLGFLLTITSVMDYLTQGHEYRTVTKSKLINCLYSILPECDSLLDVTLWSENQTSHGLFEHMLIHALTLALTLNCEEYGLLENNMIEAILSTNTISALFSSNIWTLLHKIGDINPQLLFNQIVWLCTMYKKLEKNTTMFHRSPQKVQLTHTITRLFDLMKNDDKMKICKQFRVHDDDNLSLWAALGVKSLPVEAKSAAEAVVAEKLKLQFQCLCSNPRPENFEQLIKLMSVAATCIFTEGSGIEDYIMEAWSKTCVERKFSIDHVYGATVWFHDYLRELIALTESMWHQLSMNNKNLIKILSYVTSLIQQGGVEFKLLFVNILCKMATTDIYKCKTDDFTAVFTCLYQSQDIVRNKLLNTLEQNMQNNYNLHIILRNFGDHDSWSKTKDGERIEPKDENYKYTHKCFERLIESNSINGSELKKKPSGNFDFVDHVDILFQNDTDIEESTCKKVKLDSSEAEGIIKILETETALLLTLKENLFSAECKGRIQNVCDKLNSIIH